MADYEDLGADPMGQLADLMYEDQPQYNEGWSSPGGMPSLMAQAQNQPGLNALRQKLLGIVNEPIERDPNTDAVQALSAAGAQLGAPAHNFWEALNKALYAYSSTKANQVASAEARQLKAAEAMDQLYRGSSALAVAARPQFRWAQGVGLIKSDPLTGQSNVQIGDALYQRVYNQLRPKVADAFDKVPASAFRGGLAEKLQRIEAQTQAETLRVISGQLTAGAPSGWDPMTAAPPGSGAYPLPGVFGAQPQTPQPGATPQAAAPIDYSDLAGVPPQLLDSLRRVESNGDPFAVSEKGAMGPYQHMPATAAAFRKRGWKYDPWDEEQARWATAQHLAELYKKYKNWDKALAAYNAGEPAVDSGKAAGFKETQKYVPNVLGGAGPIGPPGAGSLPGTVPVKPTVPPPAPGKKAVAPMGGPASGLPLETERHKADEAAYGGARGKALGEMEANAAQLFSTASMAENQYNLLKKLYASNANIAEGAGAETWYNIKSWAKTLGIDLGNSTDLESNVLAITREIALKHRTMTEAGNLLPGAMSNYEDKLLQSIQPGLNLTREGRMLLLDFYTELARTNKRFAEEATNYIEQNGRLDEAWYQRRNRITREEMARLAYRQQTILKEYKARTKKGK